MLNKVMIIGNLGRDPETRYTADGTAVTNFSVATSERWKDKNTGEMQEKTEWHRVTTWNRLAEICGEYLKQGSKVYVEGKLQTRKWTDKEGVEKYTTEIVASEMKMLDGRRSEDGEPAKPAAKPAKPTAKPANNSGEMDDDIPF